MFAAGSEPAADGTDLFVTDAHAKSTANYALLAAGHAYPGLYTSMWTKLRGVFRAAAVAARSGIWTLDASADFRLETQDDIGPDGVLILPKLFRRATDYLKDVDKGFDGNLSDWINSKSSGSRPENDLVLLNDGTANAVEVPFATLIEQRNANVSLTVDVCTIAFVEK